MNQPLARNAGMAAAACAAFCALIPLAVADTASDQFDREVRRLQLDLQRGEIVTETGAGLTRPAVGLAGRAGEPTAASELSTDSGSRWFDSYVEQLNRQLRQRAATAEPAS